TAASARPAGSQIRPDAVQSAPTDVKPTSISADPRPPSFQHRTPSAASRRRRNSTSPSRALSIGSVLATLRLPGSIPPPPETILRSVSCIGAPSGGLNPESPAHRAPESRVTDFPYHSGMFEWPEELRMMRDAVRQFVDNEIRPHREELEFGDLPPYDLLRKFY